MHEPSSCIAHPEVDLRLSPSAELVDLNSAQEIDIGIRYGAGKYPGLKLKLAGDGWVVVCAPSLKGRVRLKTPADLARSTLLHDDNAGWQAWLSACDVRGIDAERGPLLTDSSMVVEAALSGQGVGLVRLSLAADELASGRLLRPFPRIAPMPTEYAYYLVRRNGPQRPEVRAFCAWVEEEIAALTALRL